MTNRFMPRAISFALAVLVTWSIVAGLDTLAFTEHGGAELMAQSAAAQDLA